MKNLKQLNILVVDDHQIVRNGLKAMLNVLDIMYEITVYEASNIKTALSKIKLKNIHFVFLDYSLDSITAVEVLQEIFKINKQIKVVAISNYDEIAIVNHMLQKGAIGYVTKNISISQLKDCILMVMNSQPYFSTDILIKMLNHDDEKSIKVKNLKNYLTTREIEVLQLISLEYTNTEIAKKLFLSKRTIDSHRQHLIEKLNVKNTAGLVKYAVKNNLI